MARHVRKSLSTFAVASTLIAAGLRVPAAMSGFSGVVATTGGTGSGVVALQVANSCSANGPTAPSASCPVNILPSISATNSVAVSNTGSVPVTISSSVNSCGVATISTAGSSGQSSVVDGGITLNSYGQSAGPLSGLSMALPGTASSEITTLGSSVVGPQTFTELAWFKISSYSAGAILGFSSTVHPSGSANWDRQVWIDQSGYLVAGVYPGATDEALSTAPVKLNTWNLATVTLSTSGLTLYLNGARQQTNSAATSAQGYNGWWSVGSAKLATWPDAPALQTNGVSYFAGNLAGVAVLPTALAARQVRSVYRSTNFAAYESSITSNGPLVSWPLQDPAPTVVTQVAGATTSTTFPDQSGNGNNATANGPVTTTSAGGPLSGGATAFPGASYLSTAASAQAGPQTYTQLAWFNVGPGATGTIMGFSNSATPSAASEYDRHIWIDSSGHLVAGVYPNQVEEVMSVAPVPLNQWNLVAVTLSPTGLSLYLNGVLQQTNAVATSAQAYSGWWSIGANRLAGWTDNAPLSANGLAYFTGSLAGVAVVPSALSATQIQTLYSGEANFAAYLSAVQALGPSDEWPLSATQSTTVCSNDLATLSWAAAGTTTCIAPGAALGAACPAPGASTIALNDLGGVSMVPLAAQASGTLAYSISPTANVPANLVNADIIVGIVVSASDGPWDVVAAFPSSQSEL